MRRDHEVADALVVIAEHAAGVTTTGRWAPLLPTLPRSDPVSSSSDGGSIAVGLAAPRRLATTTGGGSMPMGGC